MTTCWMTFWIKNRGLDRSEPGSSPPEPNTSLMSTRPGRRRGGAMGDMLKPMLVLDREATFGLHGHDYFKRLTGWSHLSKRIKSMKHT